MQIKTQEPATPSGDSKSKRRVLFRVGPWFAALGIAVLATSIYKRRWGYPFDPALLATYCAVAIVLTAYWWRKMLNLDNSQWPIWATALICTVLVVCVLGLLILNDRNIFLWPRIYMYLPLSICAFGTAVGAMVTEASKNVRVYSSIGGFIFVPKP